MSGHPISSIPKSIDYDYSDVPLDDSDGNMRILVAPNSFKESLNSINVAKHIRIGLKKAPKKFKITEVPLADGGTGTVYIITKALEGDFVKCRVSGPMKKLVSATYGITPNRKVAIIELAEAAGLHLVQRNKRNPLLATTKGVGELILNAVNKGIKKIILGIGDSATIDCGVGALSVLGVKFLDKQGDSIELNCKGISKLKKIDTTGIFQKLKDVKIIIAADVNNILTGKKGALIYTKQKAARPKMMPIIIKSLKNFKKVILKKYGVDLDKIPGSGAAGGIGGAMKAILDAEIISGFGFIKEMIYLEDEIKLCDLVITGEGRIDKQSFYGKATKKIVDIAYRYKKPVILIAGTITKDARVFDKYGVIGYYGAVKSSISLKKSIKKIPELLEKLASSIGKKLKNYDLLVNEVSLK
jgi:glycerate kinase